jgi:NDP-sugar pyrophosphorylase family protein
VSATDGSGPTLPPLFSDLPAPLAGLLPAERPWVLLGDGLDRLLADLPSQAIEARLGPDARVVGDRIAIGRGTRLEPGSLVEGPVFIGQDVVLRPGAYVRGGCWIGDGCVVGTNTELKRAVLLPGAKAPHLSYVGDSILGAGVNLGAGTILSNFRHDGGEITIPTQGGRIPTGRRKLGAILGDGVRTGCNSVLSPGVVVGRATRIYAGVVLRPGIYPADSIVKLRQDLLVVARQSR